MAKGFAKSGIFYWTQEMNMLFKKDGGTPAAVGIASGIGNY